MVIRDMNVHWLGLVHGLRMNVHWLWCIHRFRVDV